MDIAIITGASSGLGHEYAKTLIDLYPDLDEIWLAERGRAIYTPGAFYRFYRLSSKLLPSAWMIKIVGKSYL